MPATLRDNLQPVYDYLEKVTGTSASRVSRSVIDHGVLKHMKQHDTASAAEYLRLLESDEQVRDELISRITIKETYFFREPAYLEMLIVRHMPKLLREEGKITLLSAGCSTGAEAYSLAIAVHSTYGASALRRCRIIGIDIDQEAVTKAKSGKFSRYALRGMNPSLRDRYLHQESEHAWSVVPLIRNSVEFRKMNLLDASQLRKLNRADVILYRNVSIYFSVETRVQVFTALSDLLTPRGVLLTGASETLAHDIGVLALTSHQGLFYFTRHSGEKPLQPKLKIQSAAVPVPAEKPSVSQKGKPRQSAVTLDAVLETARAGSYDDALIMLDSASPGKDEQIRYDIIRAGVLFHLKRFDEAAEYCRRILKEAPLSMEPYLIRAMIHRIEGEADQALGDMKKVLYLEHDCWIAAYYSAELYQQLGNRKLAVSYYRRVILTLEQQKRRDHLLVFSLNMVDSQQIIRLCRHALEYVQE